MKNMKFEIVAQMGDEHEWYFDVVDECDIEGTIRALRADAGLRAFCNGCEYSLVELEAMR